MGNLKNEYNSFLEDIQKNIKDPQDLEYITKKLNSFLDVVLEQMDRVLDYRKDEIKRMEEVQKKLDNKMGRLEETVQNIEKDIYQDDEYDFEITCPYCNYGFIADLDETNSELECPQCENMIELDWSTESGADLQKGYLSDEDEDM